MNLEDISEKVSQAVMISENYVQIEKLSNEELADLRLKVKQILWILSAAL